jgi:hypothetical protein
MSNAGEHSRDASREQPAKRKYEPPEILSQEVFETTALACGKIFGGGGKCGAQPKTS